MEKNNAYLQNKIKIFTLGLLLVVIINIMAAGS